MNNYGKQSKFCQNCGATLQPGMAFCISCGAKVDNGALGSTVNNTIPVANNVKKIHINPTMIMGVITGFLITISASVLLWNSNIDKKGFEKMFPDIAYNSWCDISKNGKTMTISVGSGFYYPDKSLDAVHDINEELGIGWTADSYYGDDFFIENDQYSFSFENDEGEDGYKAVYKIK